jgi:hypothetical protein
VELRSPSCGILEQRRDVLNGDRDPSWIGLQRFLYGIPYGVRTSSGKPFAEDLGAWLVRGLRSAGIDAEVVGLPLGSDREDAIADLVKAGRSRSLLLRLEEWYADTYFQTTLHYNLVLEVLDSRGSTVADASLSGEDDLGPKQRDGRRSVGEATSDIVSTLLTRMPVEAALVSADLVQGRADRSCTVEQILKMRESGLSEDQIHAACGD